MKPQAIFVGSVAEMEKSENEIVRQFLELDELIIPGA